MAAATQIDVCTLHEKHPKLVASDWRSPLVCKMLGSKTYADGDKEIEDTFVGKDGKPKTRIMRLKWAGLKEDFTRRTNTYQDPVLSEHAACGLACILVAERAGLEITEVAMRGDSADYWIGDRKMMIEISGHQDGKLDALLTEKKAQLLKNPHGADGYVCVAIFSECVACLRYYPYSKVV